MGQILKRTHSIIPIATICVVICLVLILFQFPPVQAQLRVWKLLPIPERLTELYYTDHRRLPTTYTPGQSQSVAFTIHNLETEAHTYRYQIVASNQAGVHVLDTATVRLAHGQRTAINRTITIPDLGERIRLDVMLSDPQQSIHYWVHRTSPTAAAPTTEATQPEVAAAGATPSTPIIYNIQSEPVAQTESEFDYRELLQSLQEEYAD